MNGHYDYIVLLFSSFYHSLGRLLTTLSLDAWFQVHRFHRIKSTMNISRSSRSGFSFFSSSWYFLIFCLLFPFNIINLDSVIFGTCAITLDFCVYCVNFLYWGLALICWFILFTYVSSTLVVFPLQCVLRSGVW